MTRAAGQLRLTALLLLVLKGTGGNSVLELDVGTEEVETLETRNTVSTVLLGGNKTLTGVETLSQRTLCSDGIKPFPGIRFAASGCYLAQPAPFVLVCGGRENLFSLSSSCWRYSLDKQSWAKEERLPLAVAGAASICTGEKMMMVGGVLEEDYYQDIADMADHYDYSTEVATSQVLEYEAAMGKWELGPSVPENIQGACGVSLGDTVILTGGKNDKECGYGSKNVWILDGGTWKSGPKMNHARFHHGCTLTEVTGRPGLVVMGGLGPDNLGDSVEFLRTNRGLEASEWIIIHKLKHPHPNQPVVSLLGDSLAVIGGGGFPYPGGEEMIEILTSDGWRSFRHVGLDRSFGLGIQVPASVSHNCEMEPNFGGHSYFRRQGEASLRDQVWFCHGERLELPLTSDKTRREVTDLVRSCTVPGCHYSGLPRDLVTRAVTGLECGLVTRDLVTCQLSCAPGHRALGGLASTSCSRDAGTWELRHLECQSIVD